MTRISLGDGISLACVTTERFKTNVLSVFLTRPLNPLDAPKNALIPSVLRRGNSNYPTLTDMSKRLADLYGAGLYPDVRKRGERHSFGLISDFINNENLRDVSNLLFETLLNPIFSDAYVLSERDNLISQIRAVKNNKSVYASARHTALAFEGEPYAVPRLGDEEQVAAITPNLLRRYYDDALSASAVSFFYCGSAEPESVGELISNHLSRVRGIALEKSDAVPICENSRHFFENNDMEQAQLSIFWRTGILPENPDYFPACVASAIYGGSSNSKLFTHVRERLSLCYTTHSVFDRYKGVMRASAGVEPSMLDRARDEMLAQWNNVVCGDFTNEEISSAKKLIISELKSLEDSPSALEQFWHGQTVYRMSSAPNDWIKAVENVTLADIIRVTKDFKLDSTYYLRAD
ncbi:MAG: insulinase family protein [Oscillospiraceae bacterium]|nr:insulinase family protein [Oscillospiraceae bacterium]